VQLLDRFTRILSQFDDGFGGVGKFKLKWGSTEFVTTLLPAGDRPFDPKAFGPSHTACWF
jgi:hypothetical protein